MTHHARQREAENPFRAIFEQAANGEPAGLALCDALKAATRALAEEDKESAESDEKRLVEALSEVVKKWRHAPSGLNELAFALIVHIEEPDDAPQGVRWLLEAGVAAGQEHQLPNDEPAQPLSTAINFSRLDAFELLLAHGGKLSEKNLAQASLEVYSAENRLGGKAPTAGQRARIDTAYAIALLAAAHAPGLDPWAGAPGDCCAMYWACCCSRDSLLEAFAQMEKSCFHGGEAAEKAAFLAPRTIQHAHSEAPIRMLAQRGFLDERGQALCVLSAMLVNQVAIMRFLLENGASDALANQWIGRPAAEREAELHALTIQKRKELAAQGALALRAWQEARALNAIVGDSAPAAQASFAQEKTGAELGAAPSGKPGRRL